MVGEDLSACRQTITSRNRPESVEGVREIPRGTYDLENELDVSEEQTVLPDWGNSCRFSSCSAGERPDDVHEGIPCATETSLVERVLFLFSYRPELLLRCVEAV